MQQTFNASPPEIQIGEALSQARKGVVANAVQLYLACFIAHSILQMCLAFLPTSLGLLKLLAMAIVHPLFLGGLLAMNDEITRGLKPGFQVIFSRFDKAVPMFGCLWLVGFAVIVGCIFLIVPGLYLAVRLSFAPYFLTLKDAGVMQSLKDSWAATDGRMIKLFIFYSACFGIMIGLALIVGILVGIPAAIAKLALGMDTTPIINFLSPIFTPLITAYFMLSAMVVFKQATEEPVVVA